MDTRVMQEYLDKNVSSYVYLNILLYCRCSLLYIYTVISLNRIITRNYYNIVYKGAVL